MGVVRRGREGGGGIYRVGVEGVGKVRVLGMAISIDLMMRVLFLGIVVRVVSEGVGSGFRMERRSRCGALNDETILVDVGLWGDRIEEEMRLDCGVAML